MRFIYITVLVLFCSACQPVNHVTAQTKTPISVLEKPKLIVGVVVDQMRYDYLTRFYDKYSDGGFKRLMNGGFNCKNNHYNYVPTYTGPGHASIYTGTTPEMHGIIGNNWYDKFINEMVYCAGDENVAPVGTLNKAGKMSPHRMQSTTIGDENRLFTQFRGKTIGISIKDRGAILPAGHSANAAYWFHGKDEGKFISSSYYFDELPKWVNDFNVSGKAKSYIKVWNTFYDISTYTESGTDLNTFENGFKGKETATFPYDLKVLGNTKSPYDIIKATPYGNSLVTDFAISAIENENLGKDNDTDVITISFSSTDYVGHNFGVNSKEIEDTYIRLDMDIERLLQNLDAKVGKGNYTLFLTADHAAIDVPRYLASKKIPAGYFDNKNFKDLLDTFIEENYGSKDLVLKISNDQIFLNESLILSKGIDISEVESTIANEIINYDNVYKAYTATAMTNTLFNDGFGRLVQKGYNQKYSGNVMYLKSPNVISYKQKGSTHGSSMNYDTHVPLLFYGKGIVKGSTFNKTEITDIAPTISALLGISFPNASSSHVLDFVLKK